MRTSDANMTAKWETGTIAQCLLTLIPSSYHWVLVWRREKGRPQVLHLDPHSAISAKAHLDRGNVLEAFSKTHKRFKMKASQAGPA
jgi:hypothetical protein